MFNVRKSWRLALAAPLAAAALLGACGGDDGGSDGDEQYVSAFCGAMADFLKAQQAPPGASGNSSQILAAAARPFDELVKALEDADPPSDAREWHEGFVADMKKMTEALKKGDMSALEGFDDIDEPPSKVDKRLSKVAEKNRDCQEAGLFAGS